MPACASNAEVADPPLRNSDKDLCPKESKLLNYSSESEENLLSCLCINAGGWLSAEEGAPKPSKSCQALLDALEPWPVPPKKDGICESPEDSESRIKNGGASLAKKEDAMDWRATSPTNADVEDSTSAGKDHEMTEEETTQGDDDEEEEANELKGDEHKLEKSNKRKNHKQRKDKKKKKAVSSDMEEDTETSESENIIVYDLRRVHNLYDTAMRVVHEIERLGNPSLKKKDYPAEHEGNKHANKKKEKPKTPRKKNKLERLAEEELAKARQIQSHLAQHREDDLNSEGDNSNCKQGENIEDKDDVVLADGGDGNDQGDNEEEESNLSPRHRAEVSINSLRYVLPLLIPIVRHPNRLDSTIRMTDGEELRTGKKAKKQTCWILGEHVYDKCTVNAFNQMRKSVECFASLVVKMSNGAGKTVDSSSFPTLDGDLLLRSLGKRFECPEEARRRSLSIFLDGCSSVGQEGGEETAQVHDDGSSASSSTTEWFLSAARACDESLVYPLVERRPHIRKKNEEAISKVHQRLTSVISNRNKDARLTIYGSCLSDLTLGGASDIDISLHLPAAQKLKEDCDAGKISSKKYESETKRLVYKIARNIEWNGSKRGGSGVTHSFIDVQPVPRARVPVVKGRDIHAGCPFSSDGSKSFDICFMNDIAVVNSSLLREYSLLDERVKLLMLAVKCWVRSKDIGSAADAFLSSYAWMNLVIFYLQCIDFVPNLQSGPLMSAHGFKPDPSNHLHTVNGLRTAFLSSDEVKKQGLWSQPKELQSMPVTALLCGFFRFYAHDFPQSLVAVSIRLGRCALLKTVFVKSRMWRLSIEDPFEIHDSYCPHDLGMHLNERGQELVMKNLMEAADNLEDFFKSAEQNEYGIRRVVSSFSNLLPYPGDSSGSGGIDKGGAKQLSHQPKDSKRKQGRQRRFHDHERGKPGGEKLSYKPTVKDALPTHRDVHEDQDSEYQNELARGNRKNHHGNEQPRYNRSHHQPHHRYSPRHDGRTNASHHHNPRGGHHRQPRQQQSFNHNAQAHPRQGENENVNTSHAEKFEAYDQSGVDSSVVSEQGQTQQKSGGRGGGHHNYRRNHRPGRGNMRHGGRGYRGRGRSSSRGGQNT